MDVFIKTKPHRLAAFRRTVATIGLVAAAGLLTAGQALADDRDHDRDHGRWEHERHDRDHWDRDHWDRGHRYGAPPVVVAPAAPQVYMPPPVVAVPPPMGLSIVLPINIR